MQFKSKALYLSVAVALVVLFLTALGPGLYSSDSSLALNWQYFVFKDFCHQQTARSFSLNGLQMAVCSRCIGIYGALLAGWILLPLLSIMGKKSGNIPKYILGASLLLNAVDVAGNYLSLWSNTNISRLLLGIVLGACISLLFRNEFFPTLTKRMSYGG